MPRHVPCRLHVVMAREAHVAVILRRGPTKWYQVIKWDTNTDQFEDGAWFHGTIHENACELSPDGKWFVYSASKYDQRLIGTDYCFCWTAVSRPPWLDAFGLWPDDSGYPPEAHFIENNRLCIYQGGRLVTHPDHVPPRKLKVEQRPRPSPPKERCVDLEIENTQWAGRDQSHRIVFAREGKIFRRENWKDIQLIDLNDRKPDPRPAPPWALR